MYLLTLNKNKLNINTKLNMHSEVKLFIKKPKKTGVPHIERFPRVVDKF